MNYMMILTIFAGICVAWYVVTSIMIYADLRRRGEDVNFVWFRIMLPWYADHYKQITKTETGKIGPLFYHWIISINVALVMVILLFIIRRLN